MKTTLVVDELRVPTRNIHASTSAVEVRKGGREDKRTGAHCENVMTRNHGRKRHAKNGGGAAWK